MRLIAVAALVAASLHGAPAAAQTEGFRKVADRDTFLSLVQNRELKRMGITLDVKADGQITGRAFGQPVTGAWQWSDGFFCRDLYWGNREIGYNCQQVEVDGSTVRFTSDRGTGQFADLQLR